MSSSGQEQERIRQNRKIDCLALRGAQIQKQQNPDIRSQTTKPGLKPIGHYKKVKQKKLRIRKLKVYLSWIKIQFEMERKPTEIEVYTKQ